MPQARPDVDSSAVHLLDEIESFYRSFEKSTLSDLSDHRLEYLLNNINLHLQSFENNLPIQSAKFRTHYELCKIYLHRLDYQSALNHAQDALVNPPTDHIPQAQYLCYYQIYSRLKLGLLSLQEAFDAYNDFWDKHFANTGFAFDSLNDELINSENVRLDTLLILALAESAHQLGDIARAIYWYEQLYIKDIKQFITTLDKPFQRAFAKSNLDYDHKYWESGVRIFNALLEKIPRGQSTHYLIVTENKLLCLDNAGQEPEQAVALAKNLNMRLNLQGQIPNPLLLARNYDIASSNFRRLNQWSSTQTYMQLCIDMTQDHPNHPMTHFFYLNYLEMSVASGQTNHCEPIIEFLREKIFDLGIVNDDNNHRFLQEQNLYRFYSYISRLKFLSLIPNINCWGAKNFNLIKANEKEFLIAVYIFEFLSAKVANKWHPELRHNIKEMRDELLKYPRSYLSEGAKQKLEKLDVSYRKKTTFNFFTSSKPLPAYQDVTLKYR